MLMFFSFATKDAINKDGFRMVILFNNKVVDSEESFQDIFGDGDICSPDGPNSMCDDEDFPFKITLHKPGYCPEGCIY